jgi:competence protein ComEC
LPGAVIALPGFELFPLMLMVLGGLWLLLWRGRWRLWGLIAIAGGLALSPFAARPDIWIDREGHLMALRLKDGRLSAIKTRKAEFSLKAWLEADGDSRSPREVAKGQGFQCDEHSCLALIAGRIVSHVIHPAALADDCRRAAILITPLSVTVPCPGPEAIIDAQALWEKGAHVIRIADGAIHVESVADSRGVRPWVIVRHRRELIPAVPAAPEKAKPEADGEVVFGLDSEAGSSQ